MKITMDADGRATPGGYFGLGLRAIALVTPQVDNGDRMSDGYFSHYTHFELALCPFTGHARGMDRKEDDQISWLFMAFAFSTSKHAKTGKTRPARKMKGVLHPITARAGRCAKPVAWHLLS